MKLLVTHSIIPSTGCVPTKYLSFEYVSAGYNHIHKHNRYISITMGWLLNVLLVHNLGQPMHNTFYH